MSSSTSYIRTSSRLRKPKTFPRFSMLSTSTYIDIFTAFDMIRFSMYGRNFILITISRKLISMHS